MNAHTAAEAYLLDFHRRVVSSTSIAFGSIPASLNGTLHASSYHALASMVPADNKALSVLDIGCGDGHLLSLLAGRKHRGLRLAGVDMSDGELDVARSVLPNDISLLKERAQELSIATGTIDVVLSHMALMLMDDIEQVLSEIHRILRPCGTLAFIVGGKGLLEPVRQLYLNELRPILREEKISLRLGDARTSTGEGWRTLLSSSFTDCKLADVDLEVSTTPSEFWDFFLSTTYDVDLLSSGGQEKLRERVLAILASNCDHNGNLRVGCGLQLITARST
ncbi:class I SAM-dependent methyltransferase [Paraburkholderia sediminicola]|uniref:class I SAM-dependent methyltransferase n=1 Tax=Paraburkholderia sediminicola TaxID=458836 RepID=UPI0038BA7141